MASSAARLAVGCKTSTSSRYNYCRHRSRRPRTHRSATYSSAIATAAAATGSSYGDRGAVEQTTDADDDDQEEDDDDSGGWSAEDEEEEYEDERHGLINDVRPTDAGHSSFSNCCCCGCCSAADSSWCSVSARRRATRPGPATGSSVRLVTSYLQRQLQRCLFVRRRRSKLALIVSLSMCVTVIKLYAATTVSVGPLHRPSSNGGHRGVDDEDDDEDSSGEGSASRIDVFGRPLMDSLGRGVLAEPDCDALEAGDEREIALSEAMLYRETKSTRDVHLVDNDAFPSANCSTSRWRRFRRQQGGLHVIAGSTAAITMTDEPSAPPRRPVVAFLIHADADSSMEQTLTLLGALKHAVAAAASSSNHDVYCVSVGRDVPRDFRRTLVERVAQQECLTNVFVRDDYDDRFRCRQSRRCPSGKPYCACATGSLGRRRERDEGSGSSSATTSVSSADWNCVSELMTFRWNYLIRLSTFHLPLRSAADLIIQRLHRRRRQPEIAKQHSQEAAAADSIIESANFTDGRAYSRRAVEQLMRSSRPLANSNESTTADGGDISYSHSLGGSTIGDNEDNGGSMSSLPAVVELTTDKRCGSSGLGSHRLSSSSRRSNGRCVFTVADLPFLGQLRTPFASAFDVNRDHLVVRCVLRPKGGR